MTFAGVGTPSLALGDGSSALSGLDGLWSRDLASATEVERLAPFEAVQQLELLLETQGADHVDHGIRGDVCDDGRLGLAIDAVHQGVSRSPVAAPHGLEVDLEVAKGRRSTITSGGGGVRYLSVHLCRPPSQIQTGAQSADI